MYTDLNTELQTSCKELYISKTNDEAKSAASAMNYSSPFINEDTSSLQRDHKTTECTETKIQSHKINSSKHIARKEYMRGYMVMRRNDYSFRKKDKALSLKSMKKIAK